VLNDFVGEIKANINTELQTRTLEENDLERIRTKYGEEFLKSLIRAEVGVVMFQNAEYNRGRPYFVNFRPILHSTRRLPDEELEKYNKYNDLVDDLEFSINELEKLKIDTFDLKMELKLIKDKIMSGSFSVVDIYLEGLSPRVDKEWEKLGKKAPKRKIELVSEDEIKKSIEEAKKQRKKVEEKEGPKTEKTAEPVKEDIENKQVTPLTFNNGVMIGTIKELKDYLKTMDDSIFAEHVNDSKNDISKWVEENFGKEFSSNLNSTDKSEIIKGLDSFGKEKKKEATKEKKKESKVKEEKKK
jgi:hypothetical protein